MFRRGLALSLVMAMATVAQAGAVIDVELVPGAPADGVAYQPGEQVQVQVLLHQSTGADIFLRLISLDYQATDSAIELKSHDFGPMFEAHQTVCALGLCGFGYEIFNTGFTDTLPIVNATFSSGSPSTQTQLLLPSIQAFNAGVVTINLPNTEGVFILDAVNTSAPDDNQGARLDYGFDPRITRTVLNGDFAGGSYAFTVVPEPATLALLGIGGLAIMRRRRSA